MYVDVAEGGGLDPSFQDVADGLAAVLPAADAHRGWERDEG